MPYNDKDITPRNDKGKEHGYWEVYHPNGKLWFRTVYINGKENGFEELYDYDGKLTHKNYYL